MRPLLLTFTLSILIANFATGQTMQTIIDNLAQHQIIEESNKKDVELILTRQGGDTSIITILQSLMYVEMVNMVGRDHMSENFDSVAPYLKMPSTEPTRQQRDSTNKDLIEYLTKIRSAGLVTDSMYAEVKANIDKNGYLIKLMLIQDLIQRITYAEYLSPKISSQQKKDYLTKKQIENALLGWEKAGILSHLTKQEISSAKKKALAEKNETLNDVLMNFPEVVHWFDTELENLKDPYAELVREFSKISHGVFKPTNVSDNFNKPIKNKVTLQFSLNGKNYSKALQLQDDWIDARFFDLVKQAVTENRLVGQFYELYEGGQGGIIIFLTPKQHQYLKANKLVVFAEDYKPQGE